MIKRIIKYFDSIVDRIFCAAGAVVFSQIPQFIRQYTDALSGALMEARRQIDSIRSMAELGGKTLEEFIGKHLSSTDPDFQNSGKVMQASVDRFAYYEAAYRALIDSAIWKKPFLFLYYLDIDLFHAVKFQPGLPLSVEGACYAFAGILAGLLVYNIIKLPYWIYRERSELKKVR